MLFFLTKRFFKRKRVGLVDLVRNIFADPRAAFIQLQRRVLLRDLLDANQNLQPSSSSIVARVDKRISIAERVTRDELGEGVAS